MSISNLSNNIDKSDANVVFTFNGNNHTIQCTTDDKMENICQKYCTKLNINMNSLLFLYGGNQINMNLKFNDQVNSMDKLNKVMQILVYKSDTDDFICPKCGEKIKLNKEKIDEIIVFNNIKDTINGIKMNIENIIKNSYSNSLNIQLKNINIILNTLNEDIKKANDKILNLLKDYSITKDKLLNNNLLDNNNLMKGISDIKLNESNNFNNGNMIDMNFSNQNNDNDIINNMNMSMNDPMNAFENNNMGYNVMNLNMVNNNNMDNMNIPINNIDNNIMNMNDMNLGARPQNMDWNNSQEQRFLSIQKSNEISILFEFKSKKCKFTLIQMKILNLEKL